MTLVDDVEEPEVNDNSGDGLGTQLDTEDVSSGDTLDDGGDSEGTSDDES